MADLLSELDKRIAVLDGEIARRAKEDEAARRLMTISDVGPIAATAIIALAPPIETSRKGRDCAARLGRAPRQHSVTGVWLIDTFHNTITGGPGYMFEPPAVRRHRNRTSPGGMYGGRMLDPAEVLQETRWKS